VPLLLYQGAPFQGTDVDYTGNGAACVFTRSGDTWTERQEFTAPDGAPDDQFGSSVAISDSTAVISAPAHTVGSNALQGAAYVFVRSGGAWSQQQELVATDGADDELGATDGFGSTVAVSGSTAMVSTGIANNFAGVAYVFTRSGRIWAQSQQLVASGSGNGFGCVVTLSGKTAVVGDQWDGSNQQGAAYVFTRSRNTWMVSQKLTASNAAPGDDFGSSVAFSHRALVVGAFHVDTQEGAAYVFSRRLGH
jgi:hypothetical protein